MAKKICVYILSLLFSVTMVSLQAQEKEGFSEVRELPSFNKITVGGAFEVEVSTGQLQKVVLESPKDIIGNIKTRVVDEELFLEYSNFLKSGTVKVHVVIPELTALNVSGASELSTTSIIESEKLKVVSSGASDIMLKVDVKDLVLNLSGASDVTVVGKADNMHGFCKGASTLKAWDLKVNNADMDISGAANAKVNVIREINATTSGSGDIELKGNPPVQVISKKSGQKDEEIMIIHDDNSGSGDIKKIVVGGVDIQVEDGDTTVVKVGNTKVYVDNDGNIKVDRNRKHKFNGHWAGFELGVNGFLNEDNEIALPDEFEFLDLRMEKSINVNFNFFEQNINLIRNHLGLVTGLGLQYNNYRFDNNIILVPDSVPVFGFKDLDNTRNYQKSKLVVNYLNVPFLLEYQTNRFSKKNSFHIAAGAVLGLRIGSHTKIVYDDGSKQKDKNRDDFNLHPFKYDLTARIGWGILNFYGTYAVNTLFKKDKGPEVYPFSIGITLSDW